MFYLAIGFVAGIAVDRFYPAPVAYAVDKVKAAWAGAKRFLTPKEG